MQQLIYYIKAAIKRTQRKLAFFVKRKQVQPQAKFALQFANMQIPELATVFNDQVHNRGLSSMHPCHDQTLIDELSRRGIDTSVINDGKSISFANPVRYDLPNNELGFVN